jgi:hypothetical protein
MNRLRLVTASVIALIPLAKVPAIALDFDIAPFARRCCLADGHTSQVAFDYDLARRAGTEAEKAVDGHYVYGLQWAEERDIKEVRVHFLAGNTLQPPTIQYWFRNWPYPPPHMPTTEDPVDDPWQGEWLKAATKVDCRGATCSYTFEPLSRAENPKASNLPGLNYRAEVAAPVCLESSPGEGGGF